jgi:hypothetical protein
MIPLIKKFNANSTLYDAIGSDSNKYFASYNAGRFVYFLKNQVTGECLVFDTLTEQTSSINAQIIEGQIINSIIEKDGIVYGFAGYDAKLFSDESVMYVYYDNVLVEESFDRLINVKHLSSSSQIIDFVIDDDSNYYVIHAKNKITKFNKFRIPQYTTTLAASSLIESLSVQPSNDISLIKMDFVAEYIGTEYRKYPIILGSVDSNKEMFLVKTNELLDQLLGAKFIGLTGVYIPYSNFTDRVNYNLTNYDYLRTKYKSKNQIIFSVALRNIYNSNDRTVVEIPIDTTLFTNENHHFAIKMDGIEGRISVYLDGNVYKKVEIDSSKYIFQQIFDDGFSIGSTYYFNNVNLNEYLKIEDAYLARDATIKNFRIYDKALSDTEIKFNLYYGNEIEDLVVSLPSDQRNQIETIETQFRLGIPGFKSNNINLIVKNTSNLDTDTKEKLKTLIFERLDKVIPKTTKIRNIEFV